MSISTQYGNLRICSLSFLIGFLLAKPDVAFAQRQMESLTRGIVAVKTRDDAVYIGWRLFAMDPKETAFNLYRCVGNNSPTLVNETPIADSTNYIDRASSDGEAVEYFVRPIVDGKEDSPSTRASVWNEPYLQIPIQAIDGYRPGDASIGDLDGDGEYEIVLHQVSRGRDNAHAGLTGKPILDAYKLDGTHLWRIDLGVNVREGEHYTQFMVYDFDGDGRVEMACKTADGARDGEDGVIGDAAKDWRTKDERSPSYGRILRKQDWDTGCLSFCPPRVRARAIFGCF